MSHSTFTECLFVGGPADGRRDMIADGLDVIYFAVSPPPPDFLDMMHADVLRELSFQVNNVAYWRKPLTAEGLKNPIQLFVFDKEVSTGWLIQKLVSAYPSSK